MQADAYLAWLDQGYTVHKTHINQLSRVRRLERAFGDLDQAFVADEMESVIAALQYTAEDARKGRPLPKGISSKASDRASTITTLRHAANLYRNFKLATTTKIPIEVPARMQLRLPPKRGSRRRKLVPTGYWMFACSQDVWNFDQWAATAQKTLLYTVASDDEALIQVGDLGVIKRNAWRKKPSAIVAIVEVIERAILRPEPDHSFFVDPNDAQAYPRVLLAILDLPDPSLAVANLPKTKAYQYIHRGLQRTTTAISQGAFETIVHLSGLSAEEVMAARARTIQGVAQAEKAARKLDPAKKERISKFIERGPFGDEVKVARQHRCQICEALGLEPAGFLKPDGQRYAEAHHVMPVSNLVAGSLGAQNIMVLCPNHHRQVHYGRYEEVKQGPSSWTIRLDGRTLEIERTVL